MELAISLGRSSARPSSFSLPSSPNARIALCWVTAVRQASAVPISRSYCLHQTHYQKPGETCSSLSPGHRSLACIGHSTNAAPVSPAFQEAVIATYLGVAPASCGSQVCGTETFPAQCLFTRQKTIVLATWNAVDCFARMAETHDIHKKMHECAQPRA